LVTDLENGKSDALTARLDPKTAGAAGWKHPAAEAVLKNLKTLSVTNSAAHAQMFVRWLRADRKKQGLEAAPVKQEVAP
jgi:hypothetical protein